MSEIVQYNDTSAYKVSTLNMALLLSMSTLTVFGNFIVLITLFKDPAKDLRTVSNILIANLATSDLILGLVGEPLFAINHWLFNPKVYLASRFVIDMFLVASFLSILALSFERYFMLKTAGIVESRFRKYHAKVSAAVIWTFACLVPVSVLFLSEKDSKMLIAFGIGCPVGLTMVCLYIKIFIVIKRVYRKDHPRANTVQEPLLDSVEKTAQRIRERELKLAWAIFAVVGVFVLFWIPAIIADTLGKVCHLTSPCHLSKDLSDLMVITGFLNAAFNPVVYSLTNKKFRKALWMLILPKNDKGELMPLIA